MAYRSYRYRGDPHWIKVRYRGKCSECGAEIKPENQAFYFPNGKSLLCQPCGEPASRQFQAEAQDEYNYNPNLPIA